MITAVSILTLSMPEEVFSGPDKVAEEYKTFAKICHPDTGGSVEAFQKLNELHKLAKEKVERGEWKVPFRLDLETDTGAKVRLNFVKEFQNGIATGYIGETVVAYVIDKQYKDLVDSAIKHIEFAHSSLKSQTEKIRKEMSIYLPKIKRFFKTKNGDCVIVFDKPKDILRLRDVFEHYGKDFNPRHAAWITSRLSNFVCWMKFCNNGKTPGITHNDLSLDTVYICPEKHTVMIIGGWWHVATEGKRMQRMQTARTLSVLPPVVKTTKTASHLTDLTLIRLLGREMLGDATGMSFTKNTSLPKPFTNWTREAPIGDPVKDMKRWDEVLVESFGVRRRTDMLITHGDIYRRK